MKNDKNINSIQRVLELISDVNREMEISKKMKSSLMVKQCQHLKIQYTNDLLELLADYKLPLSLADAA